MKKKEKVGEAGTGKGHNGINVMAGLPTVKLRVS
jgi:hypothetical protein